MTRSDVMRLRNCQHCSKGIDYVVGVSPINIERDEDGQILFLCEKDMVKTVKSAAKRYGIAASVTSLETWGTSNA